MTFIPDPKPEPRQKKVKKRIEYSRAQLKQIKQSREAMLKAKQELQDEIDEVMGRQKKKKLKSLPRLRAICDKLFSLIVRWTYMNSKGMCTCVTCAEQKHWKEIHCGHYIKRGKLWTRYHFRNGHPQCAGCNKYKDGAQDKYAIFLEDKYGYGVLQELDTLSRKQNNLFKRPEFDMIHETLKNMFDKLTPPHDYNG